MSEETTTITGRPNATLPLTGNERLVMDEVGTGARTVDAPASAIAALATKQSVGLENVDNTSDANKPVSTPQAAAIASAVSAHAAAADPHPGYLTPAEGNAAYEAAGAVAAHAAAPDPHPGYLTPAEGNAAYETAGAAASAVAAHAAAPDPHPGYLTPAEGNAAYEAAGAVAAHVAAADPHTQYALETNLAAVATSGAYGDLSGRPLLGTAAAQNVGTTAGTVPMLDGAGLIPSALLPGFVDDVLEFANLAAFPVTGETGKLYISLATNRQYRWSGSVYVEINPSPGSTDAVPEGSVNLYFTSGRGESAAASWWAASSAKTKLDEIAAGAEVNVNADWNASSGDAQILNKPPLGTAAAAATTDFATAAQGAKADTAVQSVSVTGPITSSGGATPAIGISAATTSAAGSMSAADKQKTDIAVVSNTTGITGADAVTNIVSVTQAEYDAIASPSASTLYVITS